MLAVLYFVNRDVKQPSAVTEVDVIFTQVRGFINVMDGGFRNYSSGIWCHVSRHWRCGCQGEQCSVVDTDIRGQRGLTLFANFPDGLAARGVNLALQIKLNIS